jgi:ABC-type Fe3+/spermidine/putrescine transport system ATPase subunit
MKQRIGIVRALATSPQVLLMDEPFGALDTQTRVVMQEILTNIWQQFKISVLFITHDIEESIFLSDRIYVMTARPGRIKAEIKVPLPRPRRAEMTDTPEFMNLVQELKGLIREESLAGHGSRDQGSRPFRLWNESGTERSRRNLLTVFERRGRTGAKHQSTTSTKERREERARQRRRAPASQIGEFNGKETKHTVFSTSTTSAWANSAATAAAFCAAPIPSAWTLSPSKASS